MIHGVLGRDGRIGRYAAAEIDLEAAAQAVGDLLVALGRENPLDHGLAATPRGGSPPPSPSS